MKRLFPFVLTILLFVSALTVTGQQTGNDAVGTWKFEAPYAPEGYNSGIILVSNTDNKLTASIGLTGSDYKFPGQKVRFENGQLLFSVYIEDAEISIILKMESNAKMSGNAMTPDGPIPVTLVREVIQK